MHRTPTTVCLIAVAALLAMPARGAEVEVTRARRGAISETFSEPARTRLRNTYPITMPVTGRVGYIDLEPGDRVERGQALIPFDRLPLQAALDEARAAVAELEARRDVKLDHRLEQTALEAIEAEVKAADEALKASQAQVEEHEKRYERARKHYERMKTLAADQTISESQLDDAELAWSTALLALRREQFIHAGLNAILVAIRLGPPAVRQYINEQNLEAGVIEHQMRQARARLQRAEHDLALSQVVSPVDGIVLERSERGNRTVQAGAPLLVVGDLDDLEVEADVLSQDALRLTSGSRVVLEPAADMRRIEGRVRLIEPAGFTKRSSLGVEQQRVLVVARLNRRPENLGVGYRLDATFYTATREDALIVPRFSVMQAPDGSHFVFKVAGDELVRQPVEIGLRSDLQMEILKGLEAGDTVVATPDSTMQAGMEIDPVDRDE